jgi:signal transduction histidine kinase
MVATPSTGLDVVSSPPSTDLRPAYRDESLDLCHRAARTACFLWIAITPAFVLIDYARFPSDAQGFLVVRGLYVAVNAFLLLLLATRLGPTRSREIALLSTIAGGVVIFVLMSETGGHASPYANGMGLLILGMALLMPWSAAWSILASLVLVATYVAYALLVAPDGDLRMFANNVVGFAVAGGIGAVSTVARERLRWREFKNRVSSERMYRERSASAARLKGEVEANRRLIAALEEASQVRSEFASTISHELRTPLNVMIGLAEMARDPTFDARERGEMLAGVTRAGTRLLDLVEGTLEIGRFDEPVDVDAREVSLASLWSELRRGCADMTPGPGVTLHWEDDVPGGGVHTDPGRLLVIVKNLLDNALKFTEHGWVRVGLAADDAIVTLVIEDTGIGIEPASQELVFDMFRQADGSETRRFEGAGLGLYVARHLAERLGGSIGLDSAPHRGSRFLVRLPRVPAHVAREPRPGGAVSGLMSRGAGARVAASSS